MSYQSFLQSLQKPMVVATDGKQIFVFNCAKYMMLPKELITTLPMSIPCSVGNSFFFAPFTIGDFSGFVHFRFLKEARKMQALTEIAGK